MSDPHHDPHGEDLESGGEDICRILSAAPCFLLLFSHHLHRGDTFRPFSGMGTSKGCWDAFDVLRLAFRSRELQMRFCVQLVPVCSQVPRVYFICSPHIHAFCFRNRRCRLLFHCCLRFAAILGSAVFLSFHHTRQCTALPSARPFVLVAQTITTLQEKVY